MSVGASAAGVTSPTSPSSVLSQLNPSSSLPFKYPQLGGMGGGSLLILLQAKLFGLLDQNVQ